MAPCAQARGWRSPPPRRAQAHQASLGSVGSARRSRASWQISAYGQGGRRAGALQPVVDRLAETVGGNGHDCDRIHASGVERSERGEEIRRRLDEISTRAKIDHGARELGRMRTEGKQCLAAVNATRREAK